MSPLLVFYVAKGGPDSCGPGCDSWIAVEGKVDDEAAPRLRTFLRQHKDRKLPLYFHSPGGNMTQALAMGRMLRREKVVGRVARTVLKDCAAGPQIDEDCLKLKRSGRELGATLVTRGAMCNSACPLVLFGAVTREIVPDVALGIHSPRVTLKILRGRLSEKARAEASRQAAERADRLIARYLTEMGIDHGLLDLQRTIKFEDRHLLTREELFRFGIDRREFVETSWFLEPGIRAALRKLAMEKQEGKTAFRVLQWRLSCTTASDFRLDYQRQVDGAGAPGSVSLSGQAAI